MLYNMPRKMTLGFKQKSYQQILLITLFPCKTRLARPSLFFILFFFRDMDVAFILQGLRGKLKGPIAANQINAIRGEEFDCASRAFSRANFDPESKLDVFVDGDRDGVGEGAINERGPTREFCRLLARQLQSHPIFEGPPERRTLALDSFGKITLHYM